MVIDYIEKCEMGFELVGVTITSHRVLSLIASLVVGFIFAFGSTIANALDPSAADGATPTADELLKWCGAVAATAHNATAGGSGLAVAG